MASQFVRKIMSLVAGQSWLRKIVVCTPGIREIAWRFVAGENLDAGITALRTLNAQGIKGTLNYVGTHIKDTAEAISAADAIIEALNRIDQEGLDSNVSIKLTQIGLDIDDALCRRQLKRILDCAEDLGNFVRIDMEEAKYVQQTLNIYEEMRKSFGSDTVGIVLQSYLRNRKGDLERMIASGSSIRLVKGGYWEAPELVLRKKSEIENAFQKDLEMLIPRGWNPAVATHDARFLNHTVKIAKKSGLASSAFELQLLYGVRTDLQKSLVRDGYTVRCYVPYGGNWFKYSLGCIRRIPSDVLRRVNEGLRPRL